jgi:hypothetical protein
MNRELNFTLEPTAASPSVCDHHGRFVAFGLHRCSVSDGCGSAPRWVLKRTMRTHLFISVLCAWATVAFGQLPSVVVTNVPDYGIPWEASRWLHSGQTNIQGSTWSKPLGTFSNAVHTARQIKVRYFDGRWGSEEDVRRYMVGLLHDQKNAVSTAPTWAQAVGIPEIEGSITYQDGTAGRLLLWGWVGCFQDQEHRWRFLVLQDYYRENNPKAQKLKTQPGAPPDTAPPHQ